MCYEVKNAEISVEVELDVEKITEIEWDEDAFRNLIIPKDRKVLLQSLVEAHNSGAGFDDFIKGKGRGLDINLFGPPGVGKTLSAEATSERKSFVYAKMACWTD